MPIKIISFLLLGMMMFMLNTLCSAQNGWLRSKGSLWSQISYQQWDSQSFYNLNGEKNKTNRFTTSEMSLYAEYGLTKSLTGSVYLPLSKTLEYSNTEQIRGLGDIRAEIKFKPFRGKTPFALQVGLEAPTGKAEAKAYNKDRNLGYINLPTGDGEWNVWTTAVLSKNLFKNSFGTIHVGFNYRTSYNAINLNDQFKVGGEFGYSPYKEGWLIAKYHVLFGANSPSGFTDFNRQQGTSYGQYSLMWLTTIFKRFGASIQYTGFADTFVMRKNMYSTHYFNFGVVYEIKK